MKKDESAKFGTLPQRLAETPYFYLLNQWVAAAEKKLTC